MYFRQTDRLPLLLVEIITVLDRHTIQLQQLNNKATQLLMNLEKQINYCNEVRQHSVPSGLNLTQGSSHSVPAGTEVLKRLQVQSEIKDELLFILSQLQN